MLRRVLVGLIATVDKAIGFEKTKIKRRRQLARSRNEGKFLKNAVSMNAVD